MARTLVIKTLEALSEVLGDRVYSHASAPLPRESFQQAMGFSDRSRLDKAWALVQHVHDELLLGLMQGRKK